MTKWIIITIQNFFKYPIDQISLASNALDHNRPTDPNTKQNKLDTNECADHDSCLLCQFCTTAELWNWLGFQRLIKIVSYKDKDKHMVGKIIITVAVALSIGAMAGCAGKGKGKGKGKDPEVVAPAPVYKG